MVVVVVLSVFKWLEDQLIKLTDYQKWVTTTDMS